MTRPSCHIIPLAIAAALALAAVSPAAWSQGARTIKILVPTAPGGVNDILARLIGDQVARNEGVSIVVDNRPGAGEVIGTETVARSAPDGNTLLFAANPFIINPQLRKVSYHPLTSFEPVCELATAPTLIVVNSSSPFRTVSDLLDAARAKPGSVTAASTGPGSPFHLGVEELKREAKVDITFVPFNGNAPAVNALLGGHVTAMFGTYSNVAEHLKTGQLRAIASTTRTRPEPLPDVPTVAESGFKDYEVDAWFGTFAPARTPQRTTAELAGWFRAAMQVPDVKAKLLVQGLYPTGVCGAEFAAALRKRFEDYGRVIREANIRAE